MENKSDINLFKSKIALVAVTVTLLILVATLFLSTFVININKNWLINQSHQGLIELTNALVGEYLSPADFSANNFDANKKQFKDFFRHILQNKEIVQVNLFNIDGLMISSNANYQPIPQEQASAINTLVGGTAIFEKVTTTTGGELTKIYLPIKNKDNITYGAIGIFYALSELNLHLAQAVYTIKIVILGTFSALALFILFWSVFFYKRLKEINLQLLQAQEAFKKNIELKKLFISIMNHDLKHPIGVVRTAVAILKESGESPENIRHLDKIEEVSQTMLRMIGDARIFSQLEDKEYAEKKQEIDLGALLEKIIINFKNRGYENKVVQINFERPKQGCLLSTLPILENVFINLIDNAIKYSGAKPKVDINIIKRKNDFLVSIADNGGGIPNEFKDKIFVKYKRLHNSNIEGSGLGLAIVKYIVELHKGKIWVEDNKGGGSVFKVELPKNFDLPNIQDSGKL